MFFAEKECCRASSATSCDSLPSSETDNGIHDFKISRCSSATLVSRLSKFLELTQVEERRNSNDFRLNKHRRQATQVYPRQSAFTMQLNQNRNRWKATQVSRDFPMQRRASPSISSSIPSCWIYPRFEGNESGVHLLERIVKGICPQIICCDITWMNKAKKQKKYQQIHKKEEESIDSD
ncbi:hypothetical protein LXL04_010054 [Taraxacum kok-saghyz]